MAGPAGGAQRMLDQVPAGTAMSFASALPPGRNQTTLWVSPEDQEKYKLPTARQSAAINIVNRRDLTKTAQKATAKKRTDLSRIAPGAGPARGNAADPALQGRQPGEPTGAAGVARY